MNDVLLIKPYESFKDINKNKPKKTIICSMDFETKNNTQHETKNLLSVWSYSICWYYLDDLIGEKVKNSGLPINHHLFNMYL
jgi:hypothetical protein